MYSSSLLAIGGKKSESEAANGKKRGGHIPRCRVTQVTLQLSSRRHVPARLFYDKQHPEFRKLAAVYNELSPRTQLCLSSW